MLTEKDYCDYDTCVALKELGFREKCPTYYDTEDNVGLLYNTQWTSDYMPCQITDCLESHNSNTSDDNSYVDAPNLYEAQKWLREEKKIHIEVLYQPATWTCKLYNLKGMEYIKGFTFFVSHEEALLEGIKEAIKILKEEK